MKKKDAIKVCLVGSSGGHLTHLYLLKPFVDPKFQNNVILTGTEFLTTVSYTHLDVYKRQL